MREKKNSRIRRHMRSYGILQHGVYVLKKIIITAFVRCLANGVLCSLMSRKNTGYKRRQVFDVVCGEIAVQLPLLCYRNSNECPVYITLVILYNQRNYCNLQYFLVMVCSEQELIIKSWLVKICWPRSKTM